jgi:hypothetical protein
MPDKDEGISEVSKQPQKEFLFDFGTAPEPIHPLLHYLVWYFRCSTYFTTPAGSGLSGEGGRRYSCSAEADCEPRYYEILTQRVKHLGSLPAFPSILRTLNDALSRQANEINVDRVVEEISYDKSLTAQ